MAVNQANELTRKHTLREVKGYVKKCRLLRTDATFTGAPSRIEVPVQRPSSQTRRYQVQDEVDDQQRRGQASSDSKSHCCDKSPYNTN
jgi:hypothetical protein